MNSKTLHPGSHATLIERLVRRSRSKALLLLAASLALAACKDPKPAGADTPPIAMGEESVTLRETFSGSIEAWNPVEGSWRVRSAGDDRVLAQTATNRPFPVTLWKARRFSDVDVTVRFKPISGAIDASGGIVFRARDGANYYVVRANSLEDNFRLYTVIDGDRSTIAGAHTAEPELGEWHTLRVVAVGDHIQAHLDDRLLLDHRDSTFSEGWVGLWTKADAVTEFDDVVVRGVPIGTAPPESSGRTDTGDPAEPPPEPASEPTSGQSVRASGAAAAKPSGAPLDEEAIGSIVGTAANMTEDGVVRVTWPRTAVAVQVDGMDFPAPAGLTSWAGFAPASGGAMLMGDTVVFQDEVSPAMDAAFAHGLEITALHNHFFYDEPKVYFMHIGGHGDPPELARGVQAVWDAIREVRRQRPEPASTFAGEVPDPRGSLDAAAIGRIIGVEPSVKDGGVVKVSIGREATMHGTRFSGSMGLSTWVAFTGSDERATIDGDFAMVADEVQPVLRALRRAGLHVVALHNHMVGEEPAYFFTHFWAKGSAAELARGFRAVLDAQREVRGERDG